MTRFITNNNGTIRRIRGTHGGNAAWKEHVEDSYWSNTVERRQKLARIQDQLDAEELDAVASRGMAPHSLRPHSPANRRVQTVAITAPRQPEPAPTPKVGPRFKVVWEGKGTMRAVLVN
jgi:hypothetical protein